jgi:hypothetical protein
MPRKKTGKHPLALHAQEEREEKFKQKLKQKDETAAARFAGHALRAALKKTDPKSTDGVASTVAPPPASKDVKTADKLGEQVGIKAVMRLTRGMNRAVRMTLWYGGSSASAAATAQFPVHGIRPSLSVEFTSLAQLFDEYKAHSVHYKFRIGISAASQGIDAAVGYDPGESGAYGTVIAVLPAVIHKQIAVPASFSTPTSLQKDGLWELQFTLPKGVTADPTAIGPVNTGAWTPTGLTTVDYGYMKWFVDPASAAVFTTIYYFIGVDTEFRMRS